MRSQKKIENERVNASPSTPIGEHVAVSLAMYLHQHSFIGTSHAKQSFIRPISRFMKLNSLNAPISLMSQTKTLYVLLLTIPFTITITITTNLTTTTKRATHQITITVNPLNLNHLKAANAPVKNLQSFTTKLSLKSPRLTPHFQSCLGLSQTLCPSSLLMP
jgi:hypothetical protein